MSKLITIKAYEYAELDDKAKNNFIHEMWDEPFEYEDEDEQGNTIIKYDYFGDWQLKDQVEHCEINNYIFNKYGELVGHLEEVQEIQKCDLCNGVGWIDTFNTDREVQEIQKCDDCNIYKTDKEAQESNNG